MLTIKAEASPGSYLRNEMLGQMLSLARLTDCRIEVKSNDTLFWVNPRDSLEDLHAAFDRLYSESRYVSAGLPKPVPRRD